jgi:membrane protein
VIPPRDDASVVSGPTELQRRSWWLATKCAVKGIGADDLPDWAAALTYYAVLAIFPAILAVVSLLGVIGSSATQPLIDNIATAAPGPAREIFTSALQNIQDNPGTSSVLFIAGLIGALWAASAYVGAFMNASNAIYDVGETRPIWRRLPLRLAITTVLLVLLAASALAVVMTGGLAERAGDMLGVGNSAVDAWDIAKWPVLVVIVSFMFSLLYWAAPNVRHRSFRWVTPGGIVAVALWIAASAAFAFYVANFGSYNKTYGTLGGVVIFLVWLWISNLAVLIGGELNAELERQDALLAGEQPAGNLMAGDDVGVGPAAHDRDAKTAGVHPQAERRTL